MVVDCSGTAQVLFSFCCTYPPVVATVVASGIFFGDLPLVESLQRGDSPHPSCLPVAADDWLQGENTLWCD